MEHLFRALNTDKEDELTCQGCQDLLPDYIQAETLGQAHQEQWRSVAFHLETCPHCSIEHATLLESIELAFGERGAEPPHYPAPELSFLRPEPDPVKRSWRLDDLGRLIIEFSTELVRALQPPTQQPALAAAGLKSPHKTLCQLSLREAVKDLEVTIIAEEMRDDPSRCNVVVEAHIPSRGGWPHLADTEVIFKRKETVLEIQRTDAFGKAMLEGIATDDLVHLVFEITPRP